jgi:hypothetical protein
MPIWNFTRLRTNASARSDAGLDEATALDSGDRRDWDDRSLRLRPQLTAVRVVGGRYGTKRQILRAIWMPSVWATGAGPRFLRYAGLECTNHGRALRRRPAKTVRSPG